MSGLEAMRKKTLEENFEEFRKNALFSMTPEAVEVSKTIYFAGAYVIYDDFLATNDEPTMEDLNRLKNEFCEFYKDVIEGTCEGT